MAKSTKTGGRSKGTPNKLSSGAKANIEAVFQKIGGQAEMAKWAKDNQTEFYKLYARLLPHQVTGENGGPIQTAIEVSFVAGKG